MGLKTEDITVRLGMDTYQAYLSTPEEGSHPGLIVLQEIFGVNDHIRSVCDKLASEGYACLAPDLFWRQEPGMQIGYTPEDIEHGRKLKAQANLNTLIGDLRAAYQTLRNRPECAGKKIGTIGFCFGGLMAFLSAARLDPACTVSYYGGGTAEYAGEFYSVRTPILFHFGAKDTSIPADQVETIKAAAGKTKSDWELHIYPEAGHGFNCDQRGSYHPPSAKEAWFRTMAFFQRNLH